MQPNIPAHVPAGRILPFDPWADMHTDPHRMLERVRSYGPIVFSPTHHIVGFAPNGSWMVTRSKEAKELLENTDCFSSQHTTGIPEALGEDFILAPIEADPPEHAKTRLLLNPMFSPKAVRALEGRIRQRAADLVLALRNRGKCNFVSEFAKILPSEIFLDMFGLPHEQLPQFLQWEEQIMGARDVTVRIAGLRSVAEYLREQIRRRREQPQDDVLSKVVRMSIDGRQVTESEALGTSMLLYIAGLDTVVNSLCWQFRHLAEHPADQDQLRRDPALIPRAVEEFLRNYSIVSMTRIVTRDLEFAGVAMKRGDVVSIPTPVISRDPDEFPDPQKVDIKRGARHYAFGFGRHICLGMHLARVEIAAAIEIWLSNVPPFRIAEGAAIRCQGGAVLKIESLPLVWTNA